MAQTEDKTPIKVSIKTLKIGEYVDFPIERVNSVRSVAAQYKIEMLRSGWNCDVSIDRDNFIVRVKRTA